MNTLPWETQMMLAGLMLAMLLIGAVIATILHRKG